jgi:agmatine deiminase
MTAVADGSPLPLPYPTPREEGLRWPAEWARQEALLLAWPHDPTTWGEGLPAARSALAKLAAVAGQGQRVHVLAKDAADERDARAHLAAEGARRTSVHRIPTRDAWIRDYGPLVVAGGRGPTRTRLALDFVFNAWGNKYADLVDDDGVPKRLQEVHGLPTRRVHLVLEGGSIDSNGRGTLLTTSQCLLHPNRNPHLVKEEIEAQLREWLGVHHILWLGEGIAGDDTDGHVDDVARFVNPTTVVAAVEEDPADPNFAPLRDNLRRLRAMADQDGRPLEVVPLPMPHPLLGRDGHRLPASYANFVIVNGAVAVPVFGTRRDGGAIRVLERCFPKRRVVGIRCEALVEGFGALHCLSQNLFA